LAHRETKNEKILGSWNLAPMVECMLWVHAEMCGRAAVGI
jgi:hypothetical protein